MPMNNGRDILIPKISATIPLQRKKYNAQNKEEQLKQLAFEERKNWIINEFESQIEQVYVSYREALLKAELIGQQKKLTHSAIEILLSAYSADGKHFDELLQLENELLQLDINWIEIVVATHMSKAKLERIKG